MKKLFLLIFSLFLLSACNIKVSEPPSGEVSVSNFEECMAAGNPVMESYPRQCRHNGKIFTEEVEPILPPIDRSAPNGSSDPEENCIVIGGNWIGDTRECENISQSACRELGGNFNECASACRNDPDAEICTLQCVLVCQF